MTDLTVVPGLSLALISGSPRGRMQYSVKSCRICGIDGVCMRIEHHDVGGTV